MKLNKDLIYSVIIIALLAGYAQVYYDYSYKPKAQRRIDVFYNQDTQANRKVIEKINEADKFVYFAIYTFTREDIKDALLSAKARGLKVQGVADREQTNKLSNQKKIIEELKNAGIPISFQDHLGIMHLKTLVTDKAWVSGSYNWTASATSLNDEVIEIGADPDIRSKYQKVLEELFAKYPPK